MQLNIVGCNHLVIRFLVFTRKGNFARLHLLYNILDIPAVDIGTHKLDMVQSPEGCEERGHSTAGHENPVDRPLQDGNRRIFWNAFSFRHNEKLPVGLRPCGEHDISALVVVHMESCGILQLQRVVENQLAVHILSGGIRIRTLRLGRLFLGHLRRIAHRGVCL